MQYRILHTGDWHYSGGVDDDVEISLNQITEHAALNHIDLVTVGGDVYDKTSSIESRNIVKERLMNIAQYSPIIICKGNHDQPGDLDILANLKSKYPIKVYSAPTVVRLAEGINLYVIPWFTKQHWMQAHHVDSIGDLNATLSGQLLRYITSLKKSNPAEHHILLSHTLISGARAENNQPLIGEGVTIGEFDLEEAGFDAGLLSHIHLRQQFGNGNFYYPGSPAALDFGETTDKYFSVYSVGDRSVEWYQLNSVKRICIEGSYSEGEWKPDTEYGRGKLSGARLKLIYTLSPTDDHKLAAEKIRAYYINDFAKEIKLSPIVEQKMAARADNVSKAKSLEEKLLEYWKHTGQDIENSGILKKLKQAEVACTTKELLYKA
jgi:exonuclease SbcD